MRIGVGIDDRHGTKRPVSRAIPANGGPARRDAVRRGEWSGWAGNSNGAIATSTVRLDAAWFLHAGIGYTANACVDDVQLRNGYATPASPAVGRW
jgi:hypothetical protein